MCLYCLNQTTLIFKMCSRLHHGLINTQRSTKSSARACILSLYVMMLVSLCPYLWEVFIGACCALQYVEYCSAIGRTVSKMAIQTCHN